MNCYKCNLVFSNMGCLNTHEKSCNLKISSINEIKKDYKNGFSILELSSRYRTSKSLISRILDDITRSYSEASKLAHIKHKEKYIHTTETKEILRQHRLKWMKENPEKTAWRRFNMSYPEKVFFNKIKNLKWDEKYLILRERSIFPYFIDFAFENEKIAIEIDGSQHEMPVRKELDNMKDKLLLSLGWKVIRFNAKLIQEDIDSCISIISSHLSGDIFSENGIFNYKKYLKEKKNKEITKYGFTESELKAHLCQRKAIRPPYDQLLSEIKELGYVKTGLKYNVSDNSIRKWIKMYEKHGSEF